MKLSRRQLLAITGVGVVGLVVTPLARKVPVEKYAAILIRENMPGLVISDEVITRFLADMNIYLLNNSQPDKYSRSELVTLVYRYYPENRIDYLKHKYGKRDARLMRHFVLSTNILQDKHVQAGEKPVEYIRFWHQGLPCNNPFADFTLS